MRINSDFKDCYDNLARDFSGDVIYNRYTTFTKIDVKEYKSVFPIPGYFFGFCGVIKPFYHYRDSVNNKNHNIYNIEQADKYIEEELSKQHIEGVRLKEIRKSYFSDKRPFNTSSYNPYRVSTRKFLEEEIKIPKLLALFEKHPIFIVPLEHCFWGINSGDNVFIDSKIDIYEPFKWINCYEFYQKLENFVSNLSRPEPYVPVPDDLTMRDIKGFDKFSFKKEKKLKKKRS